MVFGKKSYKRIRTHNDRTDVHYRVDLGNEYTADFTDFFNHPRIRRLRRLNQLSDVPYVIDAGDHTRYVHTTGVFYLGGRVVVQPHISLRDVEKYLVLAKAGSHDCGHGPDSHVWEIAAHAYGLPGHKDHAIEIIKGELADVLLKAASDETGRPFFPRTDIIAELEKEMRNETPLSQIVSHKILGIDRLDYIYRDCNECGIGTRPDVETILTNLVFDGETYGVKFAARDEVYQHIEALIAANRDIYLLGDVETYEGLRLRAICYAIDDARFSEGPFKIDPMVAYDYTDGELDHMIMMDNGGIPQKIMSALQTTPISEWRPVGYIKLKPYGKIAEQEVPDAIIDEVENGELKVLTRKVDLPQCVAVEKRLMEEIKGLDHTDVVVTCSPQIDRLNLGDPQLLAVENGGDVFRPMSHFDNAFMASVGNRLYDHYSIRVVASRRAWQKVRDYIRTPERLRKLLVEGNLPET